jgi:hypothetical protein
LSFIDKPTIPIGEWFESDAIVKAEYLGKYLDEINTTIKLNNENIDIKEYLQSLLYEKDEYNNIDPTNINYLYENYTMEEIVITIDLMKDFTQNFLIVDEVTKEIVYPIDCIVTPIALKINQGLLPGEYLELNQIILAANVSKSTSILDPIMISITIESEINVDLSDFAVEAIIDSTPYDITQPFTYSYLLDSNNVFDSKAIGINLYFNNNLIEVFEDIEFNTKAYNSNSNLKFYQHRLRKPTFTGSWCRFPYGPNYYLNKPNKQNIHEFIIDNPFVRQGMILQGKPNGDTAELRFTLNQRHSVDGNGTPALPMILSITRGLELDSLLTPLPIQDSKRITPIVKIMVLQGFIWS